MKNNFAIILKKIISSTPIYLIFFNILAILVHGYSFGVGDQVIHLPILNKLIDPSLYPGDSIFPLSFSHKTYIYDIILLISNYFNKNLSISYLILYLISSCIFYYGIYLLSLYLFHDKKAALLSCVFFIFPYPVAGAAMDTIELFFVPRFLSTALLLFLLTALFEKKTKIIFLMMVFIFLIHPLSGIIYSFLVIPLSLLSLKKSRKDEIYKGLIIIFLLILLLFIDFLSKLSTTTFFFFVPKDWLEILMFRNSYAFPLLWSLKSWIYLIISLIPILLLSKYSRSYYKISDEQLRILKYLIIISFFILAMQIIFTSVIPIYFVIILQLGRIFIVPIIFSIILLSGFIYKHLNLRNISELKFKAILICILIGLLLIRNQPVISTQSKDWIKTQQWAKLHTSKNCTFLVDFYSQGFRVFSHRPIVGEFKDGTISFYSYDYALNWNTKRKYFAQNENASYIKYLNEIQKNYFFSLIVLPNSITLSKQMVYKNEAYTIYRMPDLENKCVITI